MMKTRSTWHSEVAVIMLIQVRASNPEILLGHKYGKLTQRGQVERSKLWSPVILMSLLRRAAKMLYQQHDKIN